ncbi:AraC family transcriptional regulator [Rhizobium sullae]|uniref:AraC family transcriptional regulator n=1 Tax=Rhizobium sullae TaxID=50338 RepID=A0A2N0D035_RHISU|nr:AraC family transcriptional regulator [Rhizobium sullae]
MKSLGPYFGIPEAPSLTTVPVRFSSITLTKIFREVTEGEVVNVSLPCCEAYLVMLYLEDTIHSDIGADGTLAPPRWCARGSICVVDLRDGASVALHRSLSSLAIYVPKALIAEVSELSFPSKSTELRCRRGEPDSVVSNLGVVILSLFETDASETILGHLGIAICAHLLQDCIEASSIRDDVVLPHRREAAAKEFMRKNLAREVCVAEIAAAAGLSANHFSQGFKKVTGYTPHQWLMHARVDAAKELLCQNDLSLKAIADSCGFVDQSHFTKVFARETGMTPAIWRAKRIN